MGDLRIELQAPVERARKTIGKVFQSKSEEGYKKAVQKNKKTKKNKKTNRIFYSERAQRTRKFFG